MGALTIAFDTTIVGALALPWVYLVIHFFFSAGENRIRQSLDWVNKHNAQVPAGILLFAMTYTLGSAVSRIAQDFFNDDDLHVHIPMTKHLLRWPVTEDRIRADVYCDPDRNDLLPNEVGDSALAKEIRDFYEQKNLCKGTLRGWISPEWVEHHLSKGGAELRNLDDDMVETATDIFGLEENTLMDKGGDYSARLRQLHDQIMVLRGAAFNGFIAFFLCLFAWGAVASDRRGSSGKPHHWVRFVFAIFPAFLFAAASIATYHHLEERYPGFPPDPPYMEFTLFLLFFAGGWLLWPPLPKSLDTSHQPPKAGHAATAEINSLPHWRIENWGRLVVLSLVLTLAAFLGWWSTEVLYRDQVIYSFDSQYGDTQGAIAPKK